jgi:NAD(P)-dependent dehydrogenase (short-subunit alcohol dehydrogenase family)
MLFGDRLFLGANKGIGLAMLMKQINSSPDRFFALYRDEKRSQELIKLKEKYPQQLFLFQADATLDKSWPSIISWLESYQARLSHLFNSIGFLSDDLIKPEKSLRDFRQDQLLELLRVNTTTLPLAAKSICPLIPRDQLFVLASISAKVGSITDNNLGGWYSYRASKAAHNMLIKTLALEFERRFPQSVVLALHPGTVDTELSRPFSGNVKHQIFSTQQCADHLYKILVRCTPDQTGQFYSWDGQQIPW